MYFKIHHAMVDGIAGMRLVEKSLSHDPHGKSIVPPWCVEGPRAKRLKAPKVSRIKGVLSTLKGQLESTPRVIYELSQTVLKDMGRNPDYVSSFQAPSSILNQRVSASRRFAAQSFEFERLRRISKALGVTINDIVLAICSGALREYLISQDAVSYTHLTLPTKRIV